MPTTRSLLRNFTPRTPRAVRPMARTCSVGKRMAMPRSVMSTTSWVLSTRRVSMSESPSTRPMARMPPRWMFWKSERRVRFTRPWLVAKRMDCSVSMSRSGRMAQMRSSGLMFRKFTAARPLA